MVSYQKFIVIFFLVFFIEGVFSSENITWKELQKYLLPDTHPAKIALDKIPLFPAVFSSRQKLISCGFIDKNVSGLQDESWSIHVVSHPFLEGYLIKTYDIKKRDDHWNKVLPRYVQRIRNAEKIREYINTKGLNYITVPKKWLYQLPSSFKDRQSVQKFLLIVEDMEILGGCQGKGDNSYHYYHMPEGHLYQLLDILFFLKTYDATLQNIPFTQSNQLAMIDTLFSGCEGSCLMSIIPYLRFELQQDAKNYWDQLSRSGPQSAVSRGR